MKQSNSNEDFFQIQTEEQYRKLAYMFSDYIFLDSDCCIRLAGRGIEEKLHYCYGSLRNKDLSFLSEDYRFKSALMRQASKNILEWDTYRLKGKDLNIEVEACCFNITNENKGVLAVGIRNARNNLSQGLSAEIDELTYWVAHNLRGPLATIQGLIHLAAIRSNNEDISAYLQYMSHQAARLEEKIRLMVRLAGKIVGPRE